MDGFGSRTHMSPHLRRVVAGPVAPRSLLPRATAAAGVTLEVDHAGSVPAFDIVERVGTRAGWRGVEERAGQEKGIWGRTSVGECVGSFARRARDFSRPPAQVHLPVVWH